MLDDDKFAADLHAALTTWAAPRGIHVAPLTIAREAQRSHDERTRQKREHKTVRHDPAEPVFDRGKADTGAPVEITAEALRSEPVQTGDQWDGGSLWASVGAPRQESVWESLFPNGARTPIPPALKNGHRYDAPRTGHQAEQQYKRERQQAKRQGREREFHLTHAKEKARAQEWEDATLVGGGVDERKLALTVGQATREGQTRFNRRDANDVLAAEEKLSAALKALDGSPEDHELVLRGSEHGAIAEHARKSGRSESAVRRLRDKLIKQLEAQGIDLSVLGPRVTVKKKRQPEVEPDIEAAPTVEAYEATLRDRLGEGVNVDTLAPTTRQYLLDRARVNGELKSTASELAEAKRRIAEMSARIDKKKLSLSERAARDKFLRGNTAHERSLASRIADGEDENDAPPKSGRGEGNTVVHDFLYESAGGRISSGQWANLQDGQYAPSGSPEAMHEQAKADLAYLKKTNQPRDVIEQQVGVVARLEEQVGKLKAARAELTRLKHNGHSASAIAEAEARVAALESSSA